MTTKKETGTALIMTLFGFIGIAGVQHFYLDKPVKGLLWLFTLGFFGLGTLFDLLTMGDQVEEANKQAALRAEALKELYSKKKNRV